MIYWGFFANETFVTLVTNPFQCHHMVVEATALDVMAYCLPMLQL
jgi:hypothetical protein